MYMMNSYTLTLPENEQSRAFNPNRPIISIHTHTHTVPVRRHTFANCNCNLYTGFDPTPSTVFFSFGCTKIFEQIQNCVLV